MITVTETAPKVYHIVQTTHGWTGDQVQHWYYDLNKKLISEKPDFPKGMYTREMVPANYMWFTRHHLPKAVKGY